MRQNHSIMNAKIYFYFQFPDWYLNNYTVIRVEYQMCKARVHMVVKREWKELSEMESKATFC